MSPMLIRTARENQILLLNEWPQNKFSLRIQICDLNRPTVYILDFNSENEDEISMLLKFYFTGLQYFSFIIGTFFMI